MADEAHAAFCAAMRSEAKRERLTRSLEWLFEFWRACRAPLDPQALMQQEGVHDEALTALSRAVCHQWATGAEVRGLSTPPAVLDALVPALEHASRRALVSLIASQKR